jgi:UDP-N-acetylmuramate--alanine ligase
MSESYYFIGIGGIGMSGLARILLQKGDCVKGSDLHASFLTKSLENLGATIYLSQDNNPIDPRAKVIYNTSITKEHSEIKKAKSQGNTIFHRADLLKELLDNSCALTVSGTHGKTTTSALLAWTLKSCQKNPSYALGGTLLDDKFNASSGRGNIFVAEADESDGSFTKFTSFGAIVTNIGLDHLSNFSSEEALYTSFQIYMSKVESKEHFFYCGDDSLLKKMASFGFSFGFFKENDLRASNCKQNGFNISFNAHFKGKSYLDIELPLTGQHNILNGLSVFGLCLQLNLQEEEIKNAFKSFPGIGRRMEILGEKQEILCIDDYAVFPTEVACTLKALREAVNERPIKVLFQPHRYTRAKQCFDTFAKSFKEANKVFVTDIYSASEEQMEGISGYSLAENMQKELSIEVVYLPHDEIAATLLKEIKPLDTFITLGAGTVTEMGRNFYKSLDANAVNPLKLAVIIGGKSVEHDISLLSYKNMEEKKGFKNFSVHTLTINKKGQLPPQFLEKIAACDVVFPLLHGPFGEDGTLQGMLEILGKPYIGSSHRSCALTMDKLLTKELLEKKGIDVAPYLSLTQKEWEKNAHAILSAIKQRLKFPLFVKAVHLGSTFGVYQVKDATKLQETIEKCLQMDHTLLIEETIIGREIEVAVLGDRNPFALTPGEVFSNGVVYDYASKYSTKGITSISQADLDPSSKRMCEEIALNAYKYLDCSGMARVDLFLTKEGACIVNEINPIPGMTAFSLFPKMCQEAGIAEDALIKRLVLSALHKKKRCHIP